MNYEARFKTKAEAEKFRYGAWAGFPQGHPYEPSQCAEQVLESGRAASHYQCQRKPGYGPDGLYCKQHDPETKRARTKASDERYEKQMKAQRPKWYAAQILGLLIESQTSIGGDWRERRDALIAKINA